MIGLGLLALLPFQADGALFGEPTYPAEGFAGLVLLDLDRDGRLDAMGSSTWLRGSGDGSFGAEQPLPAAAQPHTPLDRLASGDIDRDGATDVVARSPGGPGVLLGDPAGGFRAWVPLPSVGAMWSAHVAHFDGDGHLDVAIYARVAGVGSVRVHFGDGSGAFTGSATSTLGVSSSYFAGTGSADFDWDGVEDLVVVGEQIRALTWYRNDHTGRFSVAQSIPGGSLSDAAVGDFDGDGWIDVISGTGEPAKLQFFRNAQGTFAAPVVTVIPGPYSYAPNFVGAFDAEGDGRPELLTGGGTGVDVWRNAPQGVLTLDTRFRPFTAHAVRAGDLDGDALVDLVWSGFQGLAVRLGRSGGGWGATATLDDGAPSELFDVDLDGVSDLLAISGTNARVRLGQGAGGFSAPIVSSLGGTLAWPQLWDLDADGVLDLVGNGSVGPSYALGSPSQPGGFGPLVSLLSGGPARDVLCLDWNGDGALDLLSVNVASYSAQANLTVFLRSASGFAPGINLYPPFVPPGALAADIDGDGRSDLLLSDPEGRVWILGPSASGASFDAQLAFVEDVSDLIAFTRTSPPGRGLLVRRSDQSLASWFLDPWGAWRREWEWGGRGPAFTRAVDVDADGNDDVLGVLGGESAFVLRGDGRGGFSSVGIHGAASVLRSVGAADLDGDQRMDLLLTSERDIGTAWVDELNVLPQDRDLPGRACVGAGSTAGCVPRISHAGRAQLSGGAEFEIGIEALAGSSRVIVLYSASRTSQPFAGGVLCVAAPRRRMPAQRTAPGVPGACSGRIELDFGRWLRGGIDPALGAGAHVVLQAWSEERVGGSRALSDALDFTVLP